MAGFEVVVRPAILPNIRPAPTRSLPPDDPEQGLATLSGSSGRLIALTYSYTGSSSTNGGTETQRTFDVARIRPAGQGSSRASGGGDTYIDVEVAKRIKVRNDSGETSTFHYTPIQEAENIEIILRDQTRSSE
jgi:hypothetical protein